jgi:tetratricopeptide (TPR) repeat protein
MSSLLLTVLAGCAAKIPVRMTLPAETDLSKYRRVSIFDFKGQGAQQVANALETTLMNQRVNGEPYFQMITRSELETILKEQNLQYQKLAERFDENSIASIGKLKGVDGLIVGAVDEYQARQQTRSEQREETNFKTKQKYNVTYNCLQRTARVRVTVKFIEVKTARLELSLPLEGNNTAEDCQPSGTSPSVADGNDMLRNATNQMLTGFARKITPHEVMKEIELRGKDDDLGFFGGGDEATKSASVHIGTGVQYATNGNWPLAIGAWEQATQAKPNSAAAFYNMGVGYEAQGKLDRAREMYQKAAQLKSDTLYIKASSVIEQRIRDAETLRHQTEGRPS